VNSPSELRKGDCIADDLVAGYLEGTLTTVVKTACEVHLISCDPCREKLAAYMRILQPEITPQENAAVESAIVQWERRGLRPLPRPEPRLSKTNRYVLGGIAAALLVGILFFLRGVLIPSQPTADDLIQNLYQLRRPFSAQLSNEPYREYSSTRNKSYEDPRKSVLLEEMNRQSADAYRHGLLHLYFGDFQNALPFLEQAASASNVPPEVLNDLGVAYFEQGNTNRAEVQFGSALEKDSKFLPAIFNLALSYEADGKHDAAKREYELYLSLDPSSGWAADVSRKLSRKDAGEQ
jgi:tetratricopeptide (TPR) repeat protein